MHYELTSIPPILPQVLNIDSSAGKVLFLLRHTTLFECRRQNRTLAPACHSHNVFHIVLFLGNENYFSLDGKASACNYGTLVITSPGQPHDFGPLQPGELSYHELTFSLLDKNGDEFDTQMGNYLADLFGLGGLLEIPIVSQLPEAKAKIISEFFMKECEALKESGGKNFSACYRHIYKLLEYIVEIFSDGGQPNTLDRTGRLEKARDYIAGNYSNNIRLDEIAGVANLSKYHFCRAFHKKFGISPKAYQIELRMQAAARLLQTSGLNCGEISNKLGFSDQYFFSKMFRERFGVSPSNFIGSSG